MRSVYISICVCIFLAWSCGESKKPSTTSYNTTPSSTTTPAPKSVEEPGKKTFDTYCKNCHGADGTLEFNGAKDLNLSTMSLDDRILLIRNGKELMTPFKGILSDDEIKAVAEYTLKFKK